MSLDIEGRRKVAGSGRGFIAGVVQLDDHIRRSQIKLPLFSRGSWFLEDSVWVSSQQSRRGMAPRLSKTDEELVAPGGLTQKILAG